MGGFESLTAWVEAQESWVFQIFFVLLLTAAGHFIARIVTRRLARTLERTRNLWDDALLHAVRVPLLILIWLLGLLWVANILQQESHASVFEGLDALHDLSIIVVLTWTAIRFIGEMELKFLQPHKSSRIDETTAMAISKLLRAVVLITSFLVVLQALGFSISGILAFGGIGGIAVGFAARDLLANFFGGIMIYLDRPFKVGDWVRSPDKNIEGTVEYIGWRQTRIRTFDKRPLYVPNATFSTISVENPSRMQNRRIKETIGLRYSDARVLPVVLEEVRGYISSHDDIATDKLIMVNFNSFSPSSLDFFIYCFTKTCDWATFHRVKEQVLLDILAIIHKHGADVAFPTQTIHIPELPAETAAGVQ